MKNTDILRQIIREEISKLKEAKFTSLDFVADQLANSMEFYDEKDFVTHIAKQTKFDPRKLKTLWDEYWKLSPHDRTTNMTFDFKKFASKYLK